MVIESTQQHVTTPAIADDAWLLTAEQSWTLCGLSKSAWYKYRSAGKIPAPVRIGGALRWRRAELEAWVGAGCPVKDAWDKMYEKN